MHQRFYFRFASALEYRSEEVVLISTNHDDARSGAWTILGERVHDRHVRATWRITSMRQEPADYGLELFSEVIR